MPQDKKQTTDRWARLSVEYYQDTKLIEVGPIGELVFVRLMALARKLVETMDIDGAIPLVRGQRELRDVFDFYLEIHPGKTFDDMLAPLVEQNLIKVENKFIIVTSYADWQTTRAEIDAARFENRQRVAAFRARKAAKDKDTEEPGGEEEEMGVYDSKVEPFTDLRESGDIRHGRNKLGKHGLAPDQVADAERVIEHLTETRKRLLGDGFRVTAAWWTDVKRILNDSGDAVGLTADQACDLIDFALQNKFWHSLTSTPAGLAKHRAKLYSSDDYVVWSKRNNRPEANRPRNNVIGNSGAAQFRGELAADKTTDWSAESGKL